MNTVSHFLAFRYKGSIDVLGCVQRSAAKLVKGLKLKAYEEQLREPGVFNLERRLKGDLIFLHNLTGGCKASGGRSLLPGNKHQDKRKRPPVVPEEV